MTALYLILMTVIGTYGSYITWFNYNINHRTIRLTQKTILIPYTIVVILLAVRCWDNDWYQYISLFQQYQQGHQPLRETEFLWAGVTQLMAKMNFTPQMFFFVMFGLQLFLFLRLIKNNFVFLLPFVTAVYMLTDMMLGTNIMRHWTAILVFLNGIPYIEKRKVWMFLQCAIIASGFHKSVLMYIPMYWFVNKKITIKIPYQILIVIFAIFVGNIWTLSIVRYLTAFMPSGYYDFYAEQGSDLNMNKSHIDSGLGMFLTYICNFLAMAYSNKLSLIYKDKHFDVVYSMFFYGCILFGALIPFGDDQRLAFYFYSTRPIVLAFLLHYLWTNRRKQKNAILYFFIWVLILAPIVRDLFNNDDIVFIHNMEQYPEVMFMYNSHFRYNL